MSEEDLIRKNSERMDNPFKVPEGYFDSFNKRLKKRLPHQQKRGLDRYLWRIAAMVTIVLGVGFTLQFILTTNKTDAPTPQHSLIAQATTENNANYELYPDEYADEAIDYAMLDNEEIELYLTQSY